MSFCSIYFFRFFVFLSIFHQSFGRGRIIGGYPINIDKAPYTVSLQYIDRHICGGSLISERFILTAAHCSSYPANMYKIRVGSTSRESGGTVISIVNVFVHPKFQDHPTPTFDFAVMQLEEISNFPKNVGFIKLPDENDEVTEGEKTLVTGWGVTHNTFEDPRNLRAVEVPIISYKKCKEDYGFIPVTDSTLCAGFPEGKKDACYGDSGGPMKRLKDDTLIGIVSWGLECALPNKPGVYSKITSARSWIKNLTNV